ncbi:MAG: site-2 protease family protein [Chloroflexi bacterium]|nr:site-2 protease family protein [Chloroflexota bacterium]
MRGVPIMRIAGVEIQVQLAWILVLALIAALALSQLQQAAPTLDEPLRWILAGLVALGFFASAVAHDLAHALMARRRGVAVRQIVISFFGGAAPDEPSATHPRDDFAIAIIGPIVSLVFGFGLLVAAVVATSLGGAIAEAAAPLLGVIGVLNLLLGGVNLVPAYPLDGGRLVRDAAWWRSGNEKTGWRVAARIGRLTALMLLGGGLLVVALGDLGNGAFVALSGWFLFLSARAINERVRVDELIGDLHVGDALELDVPAIGPGLTLDTFADQLLGEETPTTVVPVMRDDELLGVVGVAQVRRTPQSRWPNTRVEDVMLKPPRLVTLAPDDTLLSGFERIRRARSDGLPVVGPDGLVGLLTLRSIGAIVRQRMGGSPPAASPLTGGPG